MTDELNPPLRLRMMKLVRKSQTQSLTPGACVDAILEEMFRPGDAIWDAVPDHAQLGNVSDVWEAMLQAVRAGK